MEEDDASLEMRADNAVRQLRRDCDIEQYLDSMENTSAIAKRMVEQGMITPERFDSFNEDYNGVLVYFINHQEAPPLNYKKPEPRRAKNIDLSKNYEEGI